jgi:hypothetical protein
VITAAKILLALSSLLKTIFGWLGRKRIERAAEDRLIVEARRSEDARVESARRARERAVREFDAQFVREDERPPGSPPSDTG